MKFIKIGNRVINVDHVVQANWTEHRIVIELNQILPGAELSGTGPAAANHLGPRSLEFSGDDAKLWIEVFENLATLA